MFPPASFLCVKHATCSYAQWRTSTCTDGCTCKYAGCVTIHVSYGVDLLFVCGADEYW